MWGLICQASGLTGRLPSSALFNSEGLGGWERDSVRHVPVVSGCFLLIHREIWQTLGGFDPDFFMYGEDVDLCLRAAAIGARPLIDPAATIMHHGGASETIRHEKTIRLFTAKARLFRKHWNRPSARIGAYCLDIWALSRVAAFGISRLLRPSHSEAFSQWRRVFENRGAWHVPPKAPLPAPSRDGASDPRAR